MYRGTQNNLDIFPSVGNNYGNFLKEIRYPCPKLFANISYFSLLNNEAR